MQTTQIVEPKLVTYNQHGGSHGHTKRSVENFRRAGIPESDTRHREAGKGRLLWLIILAPRLRVLHGTSALFRYISVAKFKHWFWGIMQGKLSMTGCYSSNNHGAGYGLHNGGNLDVRDSRSYMDSVGVGGARGMLHAEGVLVKNARDNGFEISSECHAVLRGCTSHDAGVLPAVAALVASNCSPLALSYGSGPRIVLPLRTLLGRHGACMACMSAQRQLMPWSVVRW